MLRETKLAALWARMAAMYGHRWASSYGDDPSGPAGDTWGRGLGDLTGEQLAQGLHACASSVDGWPPSLPEFRARCLGIPEFSEVWPMLRPGAPEVTPFARLVMHYADPYALRTVDTRTERAMLREAYELACAHVMRGDPPLGCALPIAHDPTAERMLYETEHFRRLRELLAANETASQDDTKPQLPESDSGNSSNDDKGVDNA